MQAGMLQNNKFSKIYGVKKKVMVKPYKKIKRQSKNRQKLRVPRRKIMQKTMKISDCVFIVKKITIIKK